MYQKLTVQERLKDLRTVDKKMTLEMVAERTGISKSALSKYENTDKDSDISLYAITALAKFYGVTADYILGLEENKNHSDADIAKLHLSDNAIEVLENKPLNHRLLSEIISHENFERLMVDIEVCVDRIADMRINDMNNIAVEARNKIMEKYHPAENDLHMRTLEISEIDKEIFYGRLIHSDLDAIVKDIRALHKNDLTTADSRMTNDEIEKECWALINDEKFRNGTVGDRLAMMTCRSLGIDYTGLSEEEKSVIAKVFLKSPKLVSSITSKRVSKPMPHKHRRK